MLRCSVVVTCSLFATCCFAQSAPSSSPAAAQDAAALEAQYKLCANHYIPADKCTPEIYQQLKAPLDADTALAVRDAYEWVISQIFLDPGSLRVGQAYVMPDGLVCLVLGIQNQYGGTTWNSASFASSGKQESPWNVGCYAMEKQIMLDKLRRQSGGEQVPQSPVAYKDVTEKVQQALKDGR